MSTASATLRVPPHVDPRRVVDFDVYNDRRYAEVGDMHEALYRLGQESGWGIFWTPRNGGHWFINDRELLFEAARMPALFSSSAMTIPPMPNEPWLLPLYLDPPEHGAFRHPLSQAFSPKAMMKLETSIRAFAIELIEAIRAHGRCDFVEAISEPLPVKIFMKLMGLPLERMREFRQWVFDALSNDDSRRASSYENVAGLMDGLIRERQIQRQDDLISFLLDAKIDGRAVTYEEMQAYCLQLFIAGLDTVANSLSFGMNHLARNPQLQERLRNNPDLIPEAVEEFLRKFAVASPARTATRDFEFGGVQIKQGERVLLLLPAGNLDPDAFPNPLEFDLDRENKVHIAFNAGPHRCAGSHLARLELRIFYEEWFRRIPTVRHDPERPVVHRAGLVLALTKLPIVWDPPH